MLVDAVLQKETHLLGPFNTASCLYHSFPSLVVDKVKCLFGGSILAHPLAVDFAFFFLEVNEQLQKLVG